MSNIISGITLCNVPITPTNQIDFDTVEKQNEYFSYKTIHTFYPCKYQPRTGSIRIKGYVENFNNCNYGYYQNYYNGVSKRFYFWIVQKNGLARETTELKIQIDVFQTWMFDYSLTPCFIERQHVKSDGFGEHTFPENFEIGDYINKYLGNVDSMKSNPDFFMAITDGDSQNAVIGGLFGKTYCGYELYYYAYSDIKLMGETIKEMCAKGKADCIAFMFPFPSEFLINSKAIIPESGFKSGDGFGGCEGILSERIVFDNICNYFSFDEDYTPFNRKLLTHPYNFITVNNSAGSNVVLKLENYADFRNENKIEFIIESVLTQNPIFTCTPLNYSGVYCSYNDSISEQGYGLCSWNNDNFANWYAQTAHSRQAQSINAYNNLKSQNIVANRNYETSHLNNIDSAYQGAINTVGNVVKDLTSIKPISALADGVTGGSSTYFDYSKSERSIKSDLANSQLMNNTNYQNTIRSLMASVKDSAVQPNSCKGDTSSCGLDLARDNVTFHFYQSQIKPEYARKIDMYFQMYGYQVNVVEIPNTKSRKKWNYVKTVNANAIGSFPFEDRQALAEIFNNGLTIWHDEKYMYNYNVENEIIGG